MALIQTPDARLSYSRTGRGRALARAIPGSRYVELAGAGHALTIHEAARVNDPLARRFLDADQAAQAVVGR